MISAVQRLLGGLAPPLVASVLLLAGLAPAIEEQASGGGGGAAVQAKAPQRHVGHPPIGGAFEARQETAPRAGAQPTPGAGTQPGTRQSAPQTRPAGATIALQATPVPAALETALLARSDKASGQISAPAITADDAAVDQDAVDRHKDRQRRIAIALALLMLDA